VIVLPAEIADAVGRGHGVPDDVVIWDGGDASAVRKARFYVPSYMAEGWAFEVMAFMPDLEVCQLPTAGFEHALAHLPAGVTLCNAAGVHDASTAELTVALILARLRNIDGMARAMTRGEFLHDRFDALADKRVVVVGAGGVGGAIARRLLPFECDVTVVGRTARPGVLGVEDLPRLLPESDVVVLAVPLDDSTRGMVDAEFLARMRDGALIVNVARGAVAETDAMLAEAGRLRFAPDVTDPEPLPADHPLWSEPNCVITPHVGNTAAMARPLLSERIRTNVARWIDGEPLVGPVDADAGY